MKTGNDPFLVKITDRVLVPRQILTPSDFKLSAVEVLSEEFSR